MTNLTTSFEDDTDDGDPLAALGLSQQMDVNFNGLIKPWMKYCKFVVVQTIEELTSIVDAMIKHGKGALDLETEGLDSRIYYQDPNVVPGPIERPWEGETPALWPFTKHKVVGYCLSVDGKTGYYVPVRHRPADKDKNTYKNVDLVAAGREITRLCKAAQPVIDEEDLKKDPLGSVRAKIPSRCRLFFWNAKFDQEFLFPITGIDYWHPESFEDGMLMYFTRYSADKNLGLKAKSKNELKVLDAEGKPVIENNSELPYLMIELKELFPKGRAIDFPALDPYEARHYACSDAICTYLHCDKPEMQEILSNKKYSQTYRLEKQVSQVTRVMERNRIHINVEYVKQQLAEAQTEAEGYRAEIISLAATYGFNNFDPNSSKQLSEFLFSSPTGLKVEPRPEMNEKSGQYKTDADTLEKLVEENDNVNPILLIIVKYRQVDKVIGTYLTNMANNVDEFGDLRYQFRQIGAATGRFSAPAGDPEHGYGGVPIHGIPSTYDEKKPKVATHLRQAFVARDGYAMLKVDFAGEELRIVTNLSGEPVWTKEFLEGTGDLHTITARAFFGKQEVSKQERQAGKMANFSLVYGGGVGAIMRATKCNQIEAARRKQNFDKSVPIFAKWVWNQKKRVKMEKGIRTAFGRWIAIPEIDHENKAISAGAERAATNYPIQGSGADIMKIAMVRLHKEFWKRGWHHAEVVHMMLTVHDELVFEIKLEYLMQVIPVIIAGMEMRDLTDQLKWPVPLVAEALLGPTWDAKYDFHKMVHGSPYKQGDKVKKDEIVVGGKIYQKVPEIYEAYITPEWKTEGKTPEPPKVDGPPPPSQPSTPAPYEATPQVSYDEEEPAPGETPKGTTEVFVCKISLLSEQSARQVTGAIHEFWREDGKVLRLEWAENGEALISEGLHYTVDETGFVQRMRQLNL